MKNSGQLLSQGRKGDVTGDATQGVLPFINDWFWQLADGYTDYLFDYLFKLYLYVYPKIYKVSHEKEVKLILKTGVIG